MASTKSQKNLILIAKFISVITNPLNLLLLAIFLIGINRDLPINAILYSIPLFASILIYILFRIYIVRDGDLDLTKLKSRKYLGVTALIGLTLSYMISSPHFPQLNDLYAKTGLVIFVAGLVSMYWKISFHAIGFSSFVALLTLEYTNLLFLLLFLLLPIIFWARIILKKHSLKQLIVGALCGLLVFV
jgi:hypothetical protein